MASSREMVEFLDSTLSLPDYKDVSINGLQVGAPDEIERIGFAVDACLAAFRKAAEEKCQLLIVHHGLFWGGLQSLTGAHLDRVRALLEHDVALYSAHLPLDAHETFGNSALLARELGLTPAGGFARYQTVFCGVQGTADLETTTLVTACDAFARRHGGQAIASAMDPGRRTQRWAVVTGAGINSDTMREAVDCGLDTIVTGEGPHWSAVDAAEKGLVIVDVKITAESKTVGKAVKDLSLPKESKLALIIPVEGSAHVPVANTVLQAGDQIIAVTSPDSKEALQAALTGM